MKSFRNKDLKYTFVSSLKTPVISEVITEDWIKEKNMIKKDFLLEKESIYDRHFNTSLYLFEKNQGSAKFEWTDVCLKDILENKSKSGGYDKDQLIKSMNQKKKDFR